MAYRCMVQLANPFIKRTLSTLTQKYVQNAVVLSKVHHTQQAMATKHNLYTYQVTFLPMGDTGHGYLYNSTAHIQFTAAHTLREISHLNQAGLGSLATLELANTGPLKWYSLASIPTNTINTQWSTSYKRMFATMRDKNSVDTSEHLASYKSKHGLSDSHTCYGCKLKMWQKHKGVALRSGCFIAIRFILIQAWFVRQLKMWVIYIFIVDTNSRCAALWFSAVAHFQLIFESK